MELNEYLIRDLLSLENDNSVSLTNALSVLINDYHINVELLMNDNYEPYYVINVEDVIKSNMAMEDLLYIRNNGWELSSDRKYIVKFLK
jgi:tRNA A22 N-methylase